MIIVTTSNGNSLPTVNQRSHGYLATRRSELTLINYVYMYHIAQNVGGGKTLANSTEDYTLAKNMAIWHPSQIRITIDKKELANENLYDLLDLQYCSKKT